MKTIYIAYSMTNKCLDIDRINILISWIKKHGYWVLQPSYNLDPELIVSRALESIVRADIVIGDVTSYSHGVGFELGYSYAIKKKIIVVASIHAKERISKFIIGLFPEIIFYDDEDDLITMVSGQLEQLIEKQVLLT